MAMRAEVDERLMSRGNAVAKLLEKNPELTSADKKAVAALIRQLMEKLKEQQPSRGRPQRSGPTQSIASSVATFVRKKEADWKRQNNKKRIPAQVRTTFIEEGLRIRREIFPDTEQPNEELVRKILRNPKNYTWNTGPQTTREEILRHFLALEKLGAFRGDELDPET